MLKSSVWRNTHETQTGMIVRRWVNIWAILEEQSTGDEIMDEKTLQRWHFLSKMCDNFEIRSL